MRKQGNHRRAAATVVGASLAALALALPLGSASAAHTIVLQRSLVFGAFATGPTTAAYSGQLFGEKRDRGRCTKGVFVDIFVGGVFFTTVRTDRNGNFTATGPLPPLGTEATAVAPKKVWTRSEKLKKKYPKQIHDRKCPARTETKKVTQ